MSAVEEQIHRLLATTAQQGVPPEGEIAELVRRADPLRPDVEVDAAVRSIRAHLDGLGPLQPLLSDAAVTDVMVNGPGPVWVERRGVLERTSIELDRQQIELLVERVLAPLGRRADPVHALVDGRLADGSRLHVVMPPLAVDGPCLTIRRFAARPIALDQLAAPPVADLLRWAVVARCNVVVSGATGSGKTTLLNALAAGVPLGERIVTVEDAAELRLGAPHVVRLETRPASPGGGGAVSVRDLVRNALRMRPDRVIVGEVRGGEAFDLLTAMNTGHDGSLSTVHANSAADALRRLETLVLLADVGLPLPAVRAQLGSAVDLIVHVARSGDGDRRVIEVAEVSATDAGVAVRPVAIEGGRVADVRCAARSVGAPAAPGMRP